MRALLERWAKLEPERCQVGEYYAHFSLDGFQFRLWHNDVLTPRRSATLLAAVIEAIEAQEGTWDYRLAWRMAPTGEHYGVVRITRENGWEKSWSCYASSPAAALLGAYLAALEAEANQ